MIPCCLPVAWRCPLVAFAPLADEDGATLLMGAGAHPLARWSYAMGPPLRTLTWSEGDVGKPFDHVRAAMARTGGLGPPLGIPFAGGWVGTLSYELGRAFEALPWPGGDRDGWPDLDLGLHDTLGIFDRQEKRAFVVSWGLDEDLLPDAGLARARADAFVARLGTEHAKPLSVAAASIGPVAARGVVEAKAARAVRYVHTGDVFQANVSQLFAGALSADDTPWRFFERLTQQSPSPFAAYRRGADRAVVSQSPERFVTVSADGAVETRPIKGTRPRGGDAHRDAAMAAALETSEKDRAENVMIVDLMRNDLARVCVAGSVRVPRLFGLESFSTLHHLVSTVTGHLRPGLDSVDLLEASFPPGSVTGAPKVRAMEIIAELEGAPRGPYCGAMIALGFDGALDSNVAIRTAACVRDGDQWRVSFRVGGGIVADSDPSAEADETLVKARALLRALAGTEAAR